MYKVWLYINIWGQTQTLELNIFLLKLYVYYHDYNNIYV